MTTHRTPHPPVQGRRRAGLRAPGLAWTLAVLSLALAWAPALAVAQADAPAAAAPTDAPPPAATPGAATVGAIYARFNAWDYEGARALIEARAAALPAEAQTLFLRGQMAFYDGDYQAALALLDQAMTNAGPGPLKAQIDDFRQLVASTHDVSKDYAVALSPNGYFQIRYPKGKDEVLLPLAFATLEASYLAYKEDFGVAPPTPIRVEIYETAADLARVSPLTEEAIETSGTIALCKYNRLMLTSPKSLARGYGWLDTLAHEYVHMVVNIAGQGQVPIWLHEGLAKFSERRWRGGDEQRRLSPYSEHLLHQRATAGELITFEQMHPSMALLPSQEDTATAFAEVYAAMELIHALRGTAGLRAVVEAVGAGQRVEDAIAGVVGASFEGFVARWRRHLLERQRRYTGDEPPDFYSQVRFRKQASVGDADDLERIPEETARQQIHLGELMRARGRSLAAVIEYRKAAETLGDTNPILQARIGRALLDIGQVERSIEAMQKAVDDGEEYGTLYVYLGEALLEAGRLEEAEAAMLEAAALNPFDPAIHSALARVYDATERPEEAERARRHVTLLGGGALDAPPPR